MRILIIVAKNPVRKFLVELHTKELIREIKKLIGNRKHAQAIASALSKGRFEREIARHEVPQISADLILTENSAGWDLIKT
ncbi:MAG: hypothetical protein Q7S07_03055 [Candidatus Omnitrophota bacterium]|nr:hypothetical protein [Candidatus Omnitrophota bacterium]